jgi:hypothetical protein
MADGRCEKFLFSRKYYVLRLPLNIKHYLINKTALKIVPITFRKFLYFSTPKKYNPIIHLKFYKNEYYTGKY